MADPAAQPPAAPGQKDDYADKAFGQLDKKYAGGKIGAGNREKITDKLRGLFEKFSGKKVPAKVSN